MPASTRSRRRSQRLRRNHARRLRRGVQPPAQARNFSVPARLGRVLFGLLSNSFGLYGGRQLACATVASASSSAAACINRATRGAPIGSSRRRAALGQRRAARCYAALPFQLGAVELCPGARFEYLSARAFGVSNPAEGSVLLASGVAVLRGRLRATSWLSATLDGGIEARPFHPTSSAQRRGCVRDPSVFRRSRAPAGPGIFEEFPEIVMTALRQNHGIPRRLH